MSGPAFESLKWREVQSSPGPGYHEYVEVTCVADVPGGWLVRYWELDRGSTMVFVPHPSKVLVATNYVGLCESHAGAEVDFAGSGCPLCVWTARRA